MEYINNQIIRKYISYQKGGKYEQTKELLQILNSTTEPTELLGKIENETKLLEESIKNSEIYSTIDEVKFKDQVLKFHNILYNLFNNLDSQGKSSIQLKDNSIDISILEGKISKEIIKLENLFKNIIYHVDSELVGEVSKNIESYNDLLNNFQTKLDEFITKLDELKKMKFVFALDVDKLNDKILQDIKANLVKDASIESKEFNYNESFYLEAIDSKTEDIDQEIFEILNNEKMLKLFNIQSDLLNFIKSGEVFKIISPTKIYGKITYVPQDLRGPINEKTKNVEMLKNELDEIKEKLSSLKKEIKELEEILDERNIFSSSELSKYKFLSKKNEQFKTNVKFITKFYELKNKFEEGSINLVDLAKSLRKNVDIIKTNFGKKSPNISSYFYYCDITGESIDKRNVSCINRGNFEIKLKNLEDKISELEKNSKIKLEKEEELKSLIRYKNKIEIDLNETNKKLKEIGKDIPWIQKGGINLEIVFKQKEFLSNIILKLRMLLDNFIDFKEKIKDINDLNANINLSILIILLSIKNGKENKLKNISISKSIIKDIILKIRLILDYKEEGDILDFLKTFTSILNWVNNICQKIIIIMKDKYVINYDNLQNESKKFVSFIKINYHLIENLHNLISNN